LREDGGQGGAPKGGGVSREAFIGESKRDTLGLIASLMPNLQLQLYSRLDTKRGHLDLVMICSWFSAVSGAATTWGRVHRMVGFG
jgi:hypothetical protein